MINIINLNKTYNGNKVLENINMDIKNGESIAIIGESGSGKTTLAKIIIGLETQDSGKILFNNCELVKLKKRKFDICAKIQYIFQDPYSALENKYTVLKTLNETVSICKRNNYEHMSIEEVLKYVDSSLLDYMDEKVETLSGGQRQKICIARALITNPNVILADECTSMLDENSSCEILKLFHKIKEDRNTTIISIMHEIDFLNGFWDKIAIFRNGRLLEYKNFKNFYYEAENEYSLKLIEAYKYFRS